MVFEKLFKKENPNELTSAEQKAWQDIANKLIFYGGNKTKLSKENIADLALDIRADYLKIEYEFKTKLWDQVEKMMKEVEKTNGLFKDFNPENKDELKGHLSKFKDFEAISPRISFEKFLEDCKIKGEISHENLSAYVDKLILLSNNEGVVDYGPWGFTPKLSIIDQENIKTKEESVFDYHINRNCFGMTTTIASYLELQGLKFDFGISPNHPYIVLDLEDKTYLISNLRMVEFTGERKKFGDFTVLRVVEDFTDEEGDFYGPRALILVCNYDQGLIYETLENFEVLRQLALGNDVSGLPESYKKGLEIIEKYGDTLKKTDWKKLQWKLFPDLYEYFYTNKELWEIETKKTEEEYLKLRMYNVIGQILKEDYEKSEGLGSGFKDYQKKLKVEMKPYIPELIKFIIEGVPLRDEVSPNVKKVFEKIKEKFNLIFEENNKQNPKEYEAILKEMTKILQRVQREDTLPKSE